MWGRGGLQAGQNKGTFSLKKGEKGQKMRETSTKRACSVQPNEITEIGEKPKKEKGSKEKVNKGHTFNGEKKKRRPEAYPQAETKTIPPNDPEANNQEEENWNETFYNQRGSRKVCVWWGWGNLLSQRLGQPFTEEFK